MRRAATQAQAETAEICDARHTRRSNDDGGDTAGVSSEHTMVFSAIFSGYKRWRASISMDGPRQALLMFAGPAAGNVLYNIRVGRRKGGGGEIYLLDAVACRSYEPQRCASG